ncbi:hypothetical protein KR222_002850 [Zaprionus bogoriensis]|nr:hypothetical protein KR222_002850 [Zaprionus bogoriensis]
MRATGLIIVMLLMGEALSSAVLPISDIVQQQLLSPRLVYKRSDGTKFNTNRDPVAWARSLLIKLNLGMFQYKLKQAALLQGNRLLFEMEDYLVALAVVDAWNEYLEEQAENGTFDADCQLNCVSNEYRLEQTVDCFFSEPNFSFRTTN